jgi:hypothetical protein
VAAVAFSEDDKGEVVPLSPTAGEREMGKEQANAARDGLQKRLTSSKTLPHVFSASFPDPHRFIACLFPGGVCMVWVVLIRH